MKKYLGVVLFLTLAACSKDAEQVYNLVPDTGLGGDGVTLSVVAAPIDVPPVAMGSSYYGKQRLTPGTANDFTLVDGTGTKVVDFEYSSNFSRTLDVDEFSTFYIGDCPDRSTRMTWFQLDVNGALEEADVVGVFDTLSVEPGKRHILRVEYTEATGCTQIASTLMIEMQ